MFGKLDLFSLKLDRNNTMYFNNKEEQKEFFNSKVLKTINEISFNGSRPFRFSSNYLIPTFLPYNYCRFTFTNKQGNEDFTIYCFIDDILYENDNTCTLVTSYDVMQTFLFTILSSDYTSSSVKNLTLKNSDFKKYIPYTNKITPNSFIIKNIYDFGVKYENFNLGFIALNIDKNFFTSNNINADVLIDFGYNTNVVNILIPIIFAGQYFATAFDTYNFRIEAEETTTTPIITNMKFNELIGKIGSYIADGNASIIFDKLTDITWDFDNHTIIYTKDMLSGSPTEYKVLDIDGLKVISCVNNSYSVKNTNFVDLTDYLPNNLGLWRTPYFNIRIGNQIDNIEINLLDFLNQTNINSNNKRFVFLKQQSMMYPFQSVFKFGFSTEENGVIIRNINDINSKFIITPIQPVPFSISAWQQYYAQNKATINDGLATKEKYETFNIEKTLSSGTSNALGNMVIGGITFASSLGIGSVSGMNIGIGRSISALTDIQSSLTRYQIDKNNLAKERALTEIGWNDVKSSPSTFSNLSSSMIIENINKCQSTKIDIYIANNLNDIENFHKQYGYAINREERNYFTNLKRHTIFDYISFNDINFNIELPLLYKQTIEQVLENGIRFWYDYDNFLNYEIENTEIGE